ncbi:hypothetical protein U9M48_023731 [Paspalum notatum var. saurae]|uniref:Glutathione S-transferase T3-like n=1 Tax=Paspalum notatum var. saurae TaxID=547442 RepID=A0AAQ3WWE2_PASNO
MFPMEQGYFSNLLNEENTNLMFDDSSSLPDDHPIHVVPSTPSSRPNQKRSKNFNEKEDSMIVLAWLNISMDPVYGTNQTHGTFWKRVYDFYHKHKDFPSERSQSSISHRWAYIQENVNKFCGCLSRIEDRRQSGVLGLLFKKSLFKPWLCLRGKTKKTNSCIVGMSCEINQSGKISPGR